MSCPLNKSVNRPFRCIHVVVGQTHACMLHERYLAGEVRAASVGGDVDTFTVNPCIFNGSQGSPLHQLSCYTAYPHVNSYACIQPLTYKHQKTGFNMQASIIINFHGINLLELHYTISYHCLVYHYVHWYLIVGIDMKKMAAKFFALKRHLKIRFV